jgi:hypothetical protein
MSSTRRIHPIAALVLALTLGLTACSGDDDAGDDTVETTAPETTTTTAAPATSAPQTSTTTAAPATTTTAAPDTTTTTIAAGPGALAMTRVVYEPTTFVMITNVGGSPIELGQHWLCQRPSYSQLPATVLEPGDTVAIGFDGDPPSDLVGLTATFDLEGALGGVTRDDGELGLYTAASFDDVSAITDYVQWGSAGHGRESVAVGAGIWTEGAFVDVPIEATSISSSGLPSAGFEDWFADVGG